MIDEIDITKEHHKFAKESATKIQEALEGSKLKSRFNSDPYWNRYTGQLGEVIFEEWLLKKKINYDWQFMVLGEPDDYDFLINKKKWDIKTAVRRLPFDRFSPPINFNLLLNKQQVGAHADYYFWIIIWGWGKTPAGAKKAYLVGSKNALSIIDYPIVEKIEGVETYEIPITDVIPPNIALNIMRDYEE